MTTSYFFQVEINTKVLVVKILRRTYLNDLKADKTRKCVQVFYSNYEPLVKCLK